MKHLSFLLFFFLSSLLAPDLAAQTADGNLTFTITGENTVSVKAKDTNITSADIPATVTIEGKEYKVTTIGESAFFGCKALTSIIIPEGVTTIGASAFYRCSNLESVNIPEGVTTIGASAFVGCKALTSIIIPEGVTSIGQWAFYGCEALTSITIPEGVTTIGTMAFYGCKALTSITIPEGVTSIGTMAFYGCKALTSITIPEGVTSIALSVFHGCSALKEVTIPSTVISIGTRAFCECGSLARVYSFASDPPTLGPYAFLDANALTAIYVPDGSVDAYKAAENWSDFADIIKADNLTFTITGENTVSVKAKDTNITSADIPATVTIEGKEYKVTTIGESAFYGCKALTSITIPEGVTTIGAGAFSGCSALTSITIPEGVTSIESDVFYECSALKEVTIPSTVTSIGNSAFKTCSALTSITIPEGVTTIGMGAFGGCKALTSITIPEGVTTIENNTFNGCSNLESVSIPEGVTTIGAGAFNGCKALTSITIPEGVTTIGESAFHGCKALTSITIPEGVTTIGAGAFVSCGALEEVTIPSSVTTIGESAFNYCSSLTAVKCLGGDVPAIGTGVFPETVVIRVPTGSGDAYRSAGNWTAYDNLYAIGDANWSKSLTITDAVADANYIIGATQAGKFDPVCGDIVTPDGIDISDVIGIVDAVAQYGSTDDPAMLRAPRQNASGSLVAEPMTGSRVGIKLDSSIAMTALQADFVCEGAMTIDDITLSPALAATHSLILSRDEESGRVRAIVFSLSNEVIDCDSPIFDIVMGGEGDCDLKAFNIISATPSAEEHTLAFDPGSLMSSGIDGTHTSDIRIVAGEGGVVIENAMGCHVRVFDMSGREIDSFEAGSERDLHSLAPGFYIITVGNVSAKIVL